MTTWDAATTLWRNELLGTMSADSAGVRICHMRRWGHVCKRPDAATHEALMAWLNAKRWSPEYKRSVSTSLKMFYRWASDPQNAYRFMEENPAARLPKVSVPMGTPRPADDVVIRTALQQAKKRERIMLMVMATSALRRAETARINVRRDLMSDDRLVVHGKGRNGQAKIRIVPLDPALAQVMREFACPVTGWLFPNGLGGHISPPHVGVLLRRILPEGTTPHMLRHAAASALHEMGISLFELRDLLGHASIATTQRYVAVKHTKTARAITELAGKFAA